MKGYFGLNKNGEGLYIPKKLIVLSDRSKKNINSYYTCIDVIDIYYFESIKDKRIFIYNKDEWEISSIEVMDDMINKLFNMRFLNFSDRKMTNESIGLFEFVRGSIFYERKRFENDEFPNCPENLDDIFMDSEDKYRGDWWRDGGTWKEQWE